MTTSLSKSTIPPYDPNNSYSSPRQVPRVKYEGIENYEKQRGSFNICDWSIQGKNWDSARPIPKVKFEVAQQSYIKNRGYCENPPVPRKGPRISKEAQGNFIKNRGTFDTIINNYGEKNKSDEQIKPRVYYDGKINNEKGRGSMADLLANYGHHPLSARPIPRVKFEAEDILEHNRGNGVSKTLQMIPPSSRQSSSSFFNYKF